MIDVIGNFLDDHLCTNKLGKVTILTIKYLLYLYLYNNMFSYGEEIYTFTKGGPNAKTLTETLANIYLFVWQKKILRVSEGNNELFWKVIDISYGRNC